MGERLKQAEQGEFDQLIAHWSAEFAKRYTLIAERLDG